MKMISSLLIFAAMAQLAERANDPFYRKNSRESYQPKQIDTPNYMLKCLNPECKKNRCGNGSYCSPECAYNHKQIKKQLKTTQQ